MADIPRLFLITPPLDDAAAFAPVLRQTLTAADVACVLLRTAGADPRAAERTVQALAPLVQQAGAAALVEGEARRATRLEVDGVHVVGSNEALDEALAALKPDRIVGAGGMIGRDAAMRAGEAGVDYLMFGGPGTQDTHEAVCAQVEWWSALFTVPCVGYVAEPDLAADMAQAGAEFVALGEGLWERPDRVATVLAETSRAIGRLPESVR